MWSIALRCASSSRSESSRPLERRRSNSFLAEVRSAAAARSSDSSSSSSAGLDALGLDDGGEHGLAAQILAGATRGCRR